MSIPPVPPSGSQPSQGPEGSPYGPDFDLKLKELEYTFFSYPSKDGWSALQKFLKDNLSKFPKSSPEAAEALKIINHPFSNDLKKELEWATDHFAALNKALGIPT